jgi:hypothetical protein
MLKFPADDIFFLLDIRHKRKKNKHGTVTALSWESFFFNISNSIPDQFLCSILEIRVGRLPSCSDESLAFPVSLIKGKREEARRRTVWFRSGLESWFLQTHHSFLLFYVFNIFLVLGRKSSSVFKMS